MGQPMSGGRLGRRLQDKTTDNNEQMAFVSFCRQVRYSNVSLFVKLTRRFPGGSLHRCCIRNTLIRKPFRRKSLLIGLVEACP
jgi:hypothetical protein